MASAAPYRDLDTYLRTNRNRLLQELMEWRRIPSISADPAHQSDMVRSAEHLAVLYRTAGCTRADVISTAGNPIVYAERITDPNLPTILVYGHYDVQPVGNADDWRTPPFAPTVRNGKVYGRGTIDDGQLLIHAWALQAHLATHGNLPVNIKFITEGEEEVGSRNFEAFVHNNRKLLACDVVAVSDTNLFDKGVPSLVISLRGIVYFQLDIQGPKTELHSGSFGGPVTNPIDVAGYIQQQLKDTATGHIKVPGFYDGVKELSPQMRAALARVPFDDARFRQNAGDVAALGGEQGRSPLEQMWFRPTLEYHAEHGGPTQRKTAIPTSTRLFFSCRLVDGQNPPRISALVCDYITKIATQFPGVTVSIQDLDSGPPVAVDPNDPAMQAAAEAMANVYGKPVVFAGEGGSIPPVTTMQRELGAPAVLLGFGLPDNHEHAPNEHASIAELFRGARVVAQFYSRLADKLVHRLPTPTGQGLD